eukprot:jgi/Chlat1/4512/Chrsp29S04581
MAQHAPAAGAGPPLLRVLLVFSLLSFAAGSHFRYGTISWEPEPVAGKPYQVSFTINLAFRRDYDWGRYFGEKWSSNGGTSFNTLVGGVANTWFHFDQTAGVDYTSGQWMLRFPAGMGTTYTAISTTSSNNLCQYPEETGISPLCPGGTPAGTLVQAPTLVNSQGQLLYPGGLACKAAVTGTPDYCAPWSATYGFFFGDGQYTTTTITIGTVNFVNNALGNYVRGGTTFLYTYAAANAGGGHPWTAFFTGGNRIYALNNNREGRFRLEAQVAIWGTNKSPVATNIPVLPVPYTGRAQMSQYGNMATFQIAAYDPDIEGASEQQVYYRLGNRREMGYLLANSFPYAGNSQTWQKAAYTSKRSDLITGLCGGNCNNCPAVHSPPATGDFSCTLFPAWDDSVNYAFAPPDLTIRTADGVVTWETGISPFDVDTAPYVLNGVQYAPAPSPAKSPKPSGFYNLVVMIFSDSNDPAVGNISVPLDFLIYLYPPMRYCGLDCQNTLAGVSTFRDQGLYGAAKTSTDQYTGANGAQLAYGRYYYNGAGTGMCTLCGGGETLGSMSNYTVCQPVADGCVDGCPGYGIDANGQYTSVDNFCDPVDSPSNLPAVSIVPTSGSCKINHAPVWVNDGTTTHPNGDTPLKTYTGRMGFPLTFDLVAFDQDECVELLIDTTGLFDTMQLGPLAWDPTSMSLDGKVGKQVRLTFSWNPHDSNGLATNVPEDDARPGAVTVCFYAFDGYIVSTFRCIRITLVLERNIVWMDQRPALLPLRTGPTPVNNTAFYVAVNNTMSFAMAAYQGSGFSPLSIYLTQGQLPEGATLTLRPTAPDANWDPAIVDFEWTPEIGQECRYQICFLAKNNRPGATQYSSDPVDGSILDERCYTIIVTETVLNFDNVGYANAVDVSPQLTGGCGMTLSAWVYPRTDLGSTIMPIMTAGYTEKQATLETAVHQLKWYTVSPVMFNDSANVQRSGRHYQVAYSNGTSDLLVTDPVHCDAQWHHIALTIDTEGVAILYVDGVARSRFSADSRDFFQPSVLSLNVTRDDLQIPLVGNVLPADATDFFYIGGFQNDTFDGMMDEVRVYSRALTADEIGAKMFVPLVPSDEEKLVAYYKFNEGTQDDHGFNKYPPNADGTGATAPFAGEVAAAANQPLLDYSGNGHDAILSSVASFEITATPTIGTCPEDLVPNTVHVHGGQTVAVKGVNFAQSQWLQCSFSDEVVPATWISTEEIHCTAPGHPAPCSVPVEVSNDASLFSGNKISLYYMEMALEFDGEKQYAVSGVADIHTRTVAPGVCDDIHGHDTGYSVGGWVYPDASVMSDRIVFMFPSFIPIPYTIPSPPPPSPPPPSPPPPPPPSPPSPPPPPPPSPPPHPPPPPPEDGGGRKLLSTLSYLDFPGIGVFYDGTNFIYSDLDDHGDGVIVEGEVVAKPDEWHHILLTVSPDGLGTLFVDGQQDLQRDFDA